MISVHTHSQHTIYKLWIIYSGESCRNYIVAYSCLNPFFCVAWGWKLCPDMKCLMWFDSTFDKQILWRQVFFLPFCARMYVICVFVCELRAGCKIAPWVQSKSMQSKQEMATIEGGGVRGEETDGELDQSIIGGEEKWVSGTENSS